MPTRRLSHGPSQNPGGHPAGREHRIVDTLVPRREERRDAQHQARGDVLQRLLPAVGADAALQDEGLPNLHPNPPAAEHAEPPDLPATRPEQVRVDDPDREDRGAGPEREERHALLGDLERARRAAGSLRERAEHAAVVEDGLREPERLHVRGTAPDPERSVHPYEPAGDRPLEGLRLRHPVHGSAQAGCQPVGDQDRVRVRDVVGGEDQRAVLRDMLQPADADARRAPDEQTSELVGGANGPRQSVSRQPHGAARSSALASSQILTSAPGRTTVPMSRPATTIPPACTSARWRTRSVARTSGARATAETTRSTSGVLISALTSRPSMTTRSSRPSSPASTATDDASAATPGPSEGSTAWSMAAHASAR